MTAWIDSLKSTQLSGFLKNSLIVFAVLIVLFALAGSVNASGNNGNGPNSAPHHSIYSLTTNSGSEISVYIEHRNSAGQFLIVYIDGVLYREVRTQMGTFNTSLVVDDYTLNIRVQGNSIREITVLEPEVPPQELPGTITVSGPTVLGMNEFIDRLFRADWNNTVFLYTLIEVEALRHDQTPAPYAIVSSSFFFPPFVFDYVFYVEVALIDYPDVPPARHEFKVTFTDPFEYSANELIEVVKAANIDAATQQWFIEMLES